MAPSVTVQTGNITSIQEMVTRRHPNSSAEVLAAFQHFSSSDHAPFSLNQGVFTPPPQEEKEYPKADMKVTLKVFLPSFRPSAVPSAVTSFLASHHVHHVSQLIVSFPHDIAEDLSDADWLSNVLPVWQEMEALVEKGTVHTLGVSDVDVVRLRLLSDAAVSHPPSIDHYSIDGCCAVPPELVEFAKERDIQLLTHNDAREFELDEKVKGLVEKMTGSDLRDHKEEWTARYIIWLRSRSIVAGKGYVVSFSV